MIRFIIQIEVIEFDSQNYNKKVVKELERQTKVAASKFLAAALKAIPTFNPPSGGRASQRSTGFVTGAFINLKQALGGIGEFGATVPSISVSKGEETQVLSPRILQQFFARNATPRQHEALGQNRKLTREVRKNKKNIKVRIRNEFYTSPGGSKVLKTPSSGRQFSTPVDKIFQRKGNKFVFFYSVDITYFSIEDVNIGRSKFSPWQAFQKGNEAFSQYLLTSEALKNLFPSLNEFFVKKVYKVNTNGGININRLEPSIVRR
jgi:hypothetical protein